MGDTPKITLTKRWSRFAAGAVLEVLTPGEEIRPNAVDAARAAQLVADGFAGEGEPEAPAASGRKARKGGD